MVVTGYPFPNGIHSEVIVLENDNTTCQELTGLYEMAAGTGGFVQNEIMICGGNYVFWETLDNCWLLGQNKTILLDYERLDSASIVINNKVSNLISGSYGFYRITRGSPGLLRPGF